MVCQDGASAVVSSAIIGAGCCDLCLFSLQQKKTSSGEMSSNANEVCIIPSTAHHCEGKMITQPRRPPLADGPMRSVGSDLVWFRDGCGVRSMIYIACRRYAGNESKSLRCAIWCNDLLLVMRKNCTQSSTHRLHRQSITHHRSKPTHPPTKPTAMGERAELARGVFTFHFSSLHQATMKQFKALAAQLGEASLPFEEEL